MPSRGWRVRLRSPASVVRLPVRRRSTSTYSARRMKIMAKAMTYLVADDMLSIAGTLGGKTQLSWKAERMDARVSRPPTRRGHHECLTNMTPERCRAPQLGFHHRAGQNPAPEPGWAG